MSRSENNFGGAFAIHSDSKVSLDFDTGDWYLSREGMSSLMGPDVRPKNAIKGKHGHLGSQWFLSDM